MIKKIFATFLTSIYLAAAFGALSGCNTVEGAGKDIEAGGKKLKDEAREQKNQ